jgi:very-short-patch-repair endonuclease
MYRDQQQRDVARFRVIRFRNQALDENIRAVVDEIKRTLADRGECSPLPNPPRRGGGSRTKGK